MWRTIEVIDRGEQSSNDLGDHRFAIRHAVAFDAGAEVLQLRLCAGRPIAVLADQVALGLCQQRGVVIAQFHIGTFGLDQAVGLPRGLLPWLSSLGVDLPLVADDRLL